MKILFRRTFIWWKVISGYVLAILCIIGGVLAYQDSTIDLKNASQYSGVVTETGIVKNPLTIAGKYRIESDVFVFTLQGLNQSLGIYNKKQDYNFLLNNIKVGDKIKIYYNPFSRDRINIDIYQIEKEQRLIFNFIDFSKRNKIGSYIAFAGGILLMVFQTYSVNKLLKPKPLYSRE